MSDLKAQHQRPDGALIERAMAGPPKVSARELGRRIGMSDARVRQIINGYSSQGGQVLTVHGPATTVARIALTLGITAQELRDVGRADAAEALVRIGPNSFAWKASETDDAKALERLVAEAAVKVAALKIELASAESQLDDLTRRLAQAGLEARRAKSTSPAMPPDDPAYRRAAELLVETAAEQVAMERESDPAARPDDMRDAQ
ncbi:MAG: hypothetical protein J7518_16565 [Nocardioidaceae bacterium]|nr:hypothetical protein [Nocardioidaceae bacterium]